MNKVTLHINNKVHHLLVDGNESLSKVIRERAGLTGTKHGCEQGSCGACTVWIDGQPVIGCMTPTMKAHGKKITTIEGIATNGKLHPVQKHFVSKGAIQCGFCTPGMVMTAIAFLQSNPNPTDGEIREAISGNLCRCTGYKKIVEAISAAAKEIQNGSQSSETANNPSNLVGQPTPYIEAEKKVRGTAQYADDIVVPDTLYCNFVRSTHPHALIKNIDVSKAEKLQGVRYIATGKEIPNKFGVLPISEDETAMAIDRVRYIGEAVAAVAADTEAIAKAACELVEVTYHPLKAFLEMEDSLAECGADEKIHEHIRFNNNIHKKAELRFGNQEEGLQSAALKSKMSFRFQGLTHGFTEPHAATAWWDENGLTIITATQVPHYLHKSLAKVLEVPQSKIRVIKPYVGGGFGGKSDPFPHEIIISYLAKKTGKPVRCRLTREEVFISNHGRHPTMMDMSLGMSNEGKFEVLDADIVIDGGAYGSFGVVTSYYNGVLLQAPYDIQNFGFRTRRVYTNKPQSGAMRGHGAVNSRFAVETLIDDLAHRAGIDPCDIRIENFLTPDTITVGQYRITSNGSKECIETVRKNAGWHEKFGKLPQGKGIGVGCGFFISGSALPIHWNRYPQSVVHLKVDLDGKILLTSGASDIGQGSDTMLAMVAGEVLGQPLDNIFVLAADTLLTPIDLGSYSSRVTFMAGNAAKMAAENLKNTILEAVANAKEIDTTELQLSGGRLFSNDRSIDISWLEAIEIATAGVGALQSTGHYNSPKLGGNFKGAGAGLSPSYSFGAVVAEVTVDMQTGMVKVDKIWGAHDAGKAINPLAVEGQLEGSWHMGMGQALSEELRYYNGLIVNSNLLNYKIPTALDTPDIDTNIIETNDPEGPFGAKECGEGALHPVIPAIANAIFNATGVRIKSLPISAEMVRNGIRELEEIQMVE